MRNSTTENVEINTVMAQRWARMEMKRQVRHVSYAMSGHTNAWCFVFSFVHQFYSIVISSVQFSSFQVLSRVRLFVTP